MFAKRILFVKNTKIEGPGLLAKLVLERRISYDIIELDNGAHLPHSINYSGVVVLGGPDSANDSTSKMANEVNWVKKITDLGVPYLGICLGMQVLVKATGGQVTKNPVKEIGWKDPEGNPFQVELTQLGLTDPLFANMEHTLPIFHLHGETVVLEPGMVLLATGKHCTNQVVKVGKSAYGIQGHFEIDEASYEILIAQDADLKNMDIFALKNDYERAREAYMRVGRMLFGNFLNIIENEEKK